MRKFKRKGKNAKAISDSQVRCAYVVAPYIEGLAEVKEMTDNDITVFWIDANMKDDPRFPDDHHRKDVLECYIGDPETYQLQDVNISYEKLLTKDEVHNQRLMHCITQSDELNQDSLIRCVRLGIWDTEQPLSQERDEGLAEIKDLTDNDITLQWIETNRSHMDHIQCVTYPLPRDGNRIRLVTGSDECFLSRDEIEFRRLADIKKYEMYEKDEQHSSRISQAEELCDFSESVEIEHDLDAN